MNKKTIKIAGWALGLSMAVAGIGVAVGASTGKPIQLSATDGYDTLYTLDTTTSTKTNNQNYGSTGTVTVDGIEWTFTGNGNINPWRLGGKTAASGDQPFYTNTAYAKAINRIEVTFGEVDGVTLTSFSASIHNSASDAASGNNPVATFENLDFAENSTTVIDLGDSYSGKYYRFVPNLSISATKNKYLQLSRVEFLAPSTISATGVSIVSTNYTPDKGVITIEKDTGDGSVEDTLIATVAPNDATVKTVTWSSDNESVALVDENEGTVLIDTSKAGEATITATANGGTNVTATIKYVIEDSSAQEYNITTTVTNGSFSGAQTIRENASATVTISPSVGYKLPASVSVTNATLASYDSSTGAVVISNPTGEVTITASMVQLATYSITITENNASHTGDSTIKEQSEANLTFTADNKYSLPAEIAVTGATYEWDSSTGTLSLSNPTGNVAIVITATEVPYTVTDVITASSLEATTTSYVEFSGKTFTSKAEYAGQNAKNAAGAIQLRATNPAGVVTTKSAYKRVYSITLTVSSGSNDIDIYASTSAYDSGASLYSNSTQGTKVATFNSTGTYVFADNENYQYIGVRSNSKATYLTNITVVWEGYYADELADVIKTMAGGWANDVETNSCASNYSTAKEKVLTLSSDELNTFKTSADSDIAAARKTYEHWCDVNGDATPWSGAIVSNANRSSLQSHVFSMDTTSGAMLVVTITAVTGLAAATGFAFLRRKKEDR